MKYTVIIALLWITINLNAQSDTSYLEIKQVEVIKDFEAIIQNASLLTVKPVTPQSKDFNPNYKYSISVFPVKAVDIKPQIMPLSINQDPPFIVKKGYIFGAYGIKNNFNLMAGYHLAQKDRYDAGIHLGYNALDNTSSVPYQKYSNTQIALYGNYLLKENLKLYGQVNTSFQNRYMYHNDLGIDTLYEESELRRKINSYNVNIGLANPESTKYNINYDLKLNFHNMSIADNQSNDNGFGIQGMAAKQFGINSVLYFNSDFNYTAYRDSLDLEISTATFIPHFKTKIGNLLLDGGVNILYTSDGQSSVFPEAELAWSLPQGNLMVFAGIKQQYYTNTFTQIAPRNPYLNTRIDSLGTTVWQEYSGGLKGKFSFLGYQVKAGFKNIKNQMFLINNPNDLRFFDMLYDDMGSTFISGNLDFNFSRMFEFGGWLTQNIFKPKTLSKAWHTPALESNAYVVIKLLDDKLKLKGDLYLGSPVFYINKIGDEDRSGVLFDLNIEADYALFENLHINLKGINLLNNKYERYYGYPAVGLLARAGIRWIF